MNNDVCLKCYTKITNLKIDIIRLQSELENKRVPKEFEFLLLELVKLMNDALDRKDYRYLSVITKTLREYRAGCILPG